MKRPPSDQIEAHKKLKKDHAFLQQKCDQYEQAYTNLIHQVKQMQRDRFGQRSERYTDPANPQTSMFDAGADPSPDSSSDDTNEAEVDPAVENSNVVDLKAVRRKKKANRSLPDHLPRKEVHIKVDKEQRVCGCGCQKKPLKPERHERLHYQPAVFEAIVELRERLACPNGCFGEFVTAPKPNHILPKSRLSESLLAHLIVSKLDDRQPLYHLEKQFEKRAGFTLSRQTMARSMMGCAEHLQPLFNLMKDEVIDYPIGALDATSLQVLNEPGRPPTKKSYAYCFRGGEPGKEAILYDYNAIDHKPFVKDWYAGFEGKLHCDADPFFELLFESPQIHPSYCNAHARRKFEVITNMTHSQGLAHQAMRFYRRLYWVEREAKTRQMNAHQRYHLRQTKSVPIMEAFKVWLDEHYPLVMPKSPLGRAFAYSLNHWTGLCAFLHDGRLKIDNNLTEQEIKPFVIARKNFLFCASVRGARALALHFSLIRTAKKHNLDPYQYYVAILQAVPHCNTVEDYEALLPWNIEMAQVGAVKIAA